MLGSEIVVAVPDSFSGVRLEKEILAPAGYQVTVVLAGDKLTDLLDSSAGVEIVFMASRLADMDGLQLGALLIEKHPLVPFIFMAIEPSPELYIQAFRAGFWDCLPLNAKQDEVFRAIQVCSARKARLQDWLKLQKQDIEVELKKLEKILAEIEDGVIVVDPENRLVIANATACSILEIKSTKIGQPVNEVIRQPDLLESFEEHSGHPTRHELSLEDGRVFNAQVTPIANVGIVVTMQDITDLKELDRIKSEFVSTVSHDLRSPLTAILGYIELITRVGPVNDTQKEFIRRVQVSVQNITSLISDLLDLGRIEAGLDTRNEFISLGVVLQHAVDTFAPLAKEKDQQLSIDIPGNLPKVLGSPVHLRQVANNLIGNAYKYTPRGGMIVLKAMVNEGQVIFQVSDNGPGIPPSDQPYVFDKFYRASNVDSDTPGTGLGLAIVRSIVESHGGRVWVESVLGQGTMFTVMLPAA